MKQFLLKKIENIILQVFEYYHISLNDLERYILSDLDNYFILISTIGSIRRGIEKTNIIINLFFSDKDNVFAPMLLTKLKYRFYLQLLLFFEIKDSR